MIIGDQPKMARIPESQFEIGVEAPDREYLCAIVALGVGPRYLFDFINTRIRKAAVLSLIRTFSEGRMPFKGGQIGQSESVLRFGRDRQWPVDRINRSPKNFSQGRTGLFERVGNLEGLRQGS
jgi:hypothetical protein